MGDEASQRKGCAVPERCRPSDLFFRGRSSAGNIMNTALARRLALGDRVTWAGKNDYQPSGPGTITRITAHQVEVLWEGNREALSPHATAQPSTLETLLRAQSPNSTARAGSLAMRNDDRLNIPAEQPRGRTSLDEYGRGAESDCARAMAEIERVLHELAI